MTVMIAKVLSECSQVVLITIIMRRDETKTTGESVWSGLPDEHDLWFSRFVGQCFEIEETCGSIYRNTPIISELNCPPDKRRMIFGTHFSRRSPSTWLWSLFSGWKRSPSSSTFRYPVRKRFIVHQNVSTENMFAFALGFGGKDCRIASIVDGAGNQALELEKRKIDGHLRNLVCLFTRLNCDWSGSRSLAGEVVAPALRVLSSNTLYIPREQSPATQLMMVVVVQVQRGPCAIDCESCN